MISRTVHNIIPTSSCEVMVKILMAAKTYLPLIETNHSIHISDNIKQEILVLHELTEKTLKEIERKKERRGVNAIDEEEQPPDNFRDINVYPSATEVTYSDRPYLRRNIIDRPYENIEQYLDIQFRLLREDFVKPLREGICKYIRDPKIRKIDDIKIYQVIRFLCMENVNEQNCFRIQFDFNKHKRKQKINYEHSRRFMFGSLLCFTADNFVTILFGKVVQRDIKDLEQSQLIVGFDDDVILPYNIFDLEFLMVESSVFFEPYYQVLNVLKTMEIDRFPMKRYIIDVRRDQRPPEYLLNIDPQYFTIEDETFWPLDWADRKFYNLNESQEQAFRAALTQEFAIIQGPPGTGKTFLGLKIAKTLIENSSVWYRDCPILVICFTNHALDQFLEGLVEVTDKIVRVGSQSKNKNIEKFNIRKKRFNYSNESVGQKRREVRSFLTEIQGINDTLRLIGEGQTLFNFEIFQGVIPLYEYSKFARFDNNIMLHWLFSGMMQSERKPMVSCCIDKCY